MKIRSKFAATLAAGACALAVAGGAMGIVTFDPATGTGFVGKGDVQTAFTWNNKALQDNAAGVTFNYSSTETYEAVCQWFTGPAHNRKSHIKERTRTTGVNATVSYDARQRNQITGFTLTGFGANTVSGDELPVVGGACQGDDEHGTNGEWISVELTGTSGNGLTATFGGTTVPLQ